MNDDVLNLCLRLDAYLDGDLSIVERAAFAEHLNDCAACSDAVEEQQWIEGLLQSEAAAEIEAAPRPHRIHRIKIRARRRWLVVAAAAAFAAFAAWPLIPLPRRDGSNGARSPVATERRAVAESDSTPAVSAIVENPSPNPSLPGRGIDAPVATFVSTGAAIAIPSSSSSPEVTVVKLYPTLPAARRWARATAVSLNAPSLNGG